MTLHARVSRRLGGLDLAVDITVADGEVVAVLGPNGAGKTTLLRCLAGLEPVGAGRVALDDVTWEDTDEQSRLPVQRRSLGFVFQDHLLFPHLSAMENVAFGPRSRGVGKREAGRRAIRWLERVGLGDVASARPSALSGGQAQRVALARALASEPGVLLLDEPMAALDVAARQAVRRVLRDHLDAFEGPCLLVTHEPLEAIALADRLVIIEDGRVVQDGPAADVARQPRSEWVARLVGLNLYRGRAAGHDVEMQSGARLVADAAAEGDVFAVVHPRAVALHRRPPEGSPRNAWRATINGIDLHGDGVRVHTDGPLPMVAQITPAALAALDLVEGDEVWVAVKAAEIDLFPR